MNVLAFDTCLGAVSVAVRRQGADGAWLLNDAYEEMDIGHAERLMPMIADVMAGAHLSFAGIDRIAVTKGPGSFTGVRVGVAAARALALATRKPVVAETSLAVMAAQAKTTLGAELGMATLIVAVDARRGALYLQVFDPEAGPSQAEVLPLDEAGRRFGDHAGAIAVGSGAEILSKAASGTVKAMLPNLQPHARALAMLAETLPPIEALKPLYLRQPDAKPQTGSALPRAD
jgi:tRNA threonylcarbamoyladenosine biosynthesis protein TsaB